MALELYIYSKNCLISYLYSIKKTSVKIPFNLTIKLVLLD